VKNFLQTKKIIIAGISGAVLMLAVVIGALFISPNMVDAATASTSTNNTKNTYCTLYDQELAKSLNVSPQTLNQDRKTTLTDVINQMVKDGKMKQARATALEKRINASTGANCSELATALRNHRSALRPYRQEVLNTVAQDLHLSSSQLTSQLKTGKSLNTIAQAQNVSQTSLHTMVLNAVKAAVNNAVTAKKITQQRANTIDTFLQNHPQIINRITSHQFGQQNTNATPTATATTTTN
jgi:AraC-like DNA-binding protein